MMFVRQVVLKDEMKLREIAKEILVPIYGSQEKAISEWLNGTGFKNAFVSCTESGEITGLLSLKANPQKSFLKIATLVVVAGFRGLNIGTELLCCSLSFAKKHNYNQIIVTVSETKPEVIKFFAKAGFVTVKSCPDKYIDGITEFVMLREM